MGEKSPLGLLPDHLLLDVLGYLETARDVSNLIACSRATRNVLQQDGWKAFVRARFPSLAIPRTVATAWGSVAKQLTYLDRCWERRACTLHHYLEETSSPESGRGRRPPFGRSRQGQSVAFQAVLDARLLSSPHEEVLACGVGENLLVRWRPLSGEKLDSWRTLAGRDAGYEAGIGDITALTAIERGTSQEIVVGRADGEVTLLYGGRDSRFGRETARLLPLDIEKLSQRSSPGQRAVTWVEYRPQTRMLARCRSSLLTLYDLSVSDASEVPSISHHDTTNGIERGDTPLIRCVRFLSDDTVACGLGRSREPLRWGKIRPTGMELAAPSRYHADETPSQTIRAIQPVGGPEHAHSLLSAWDDGSYRLIDMRTRSEHDAIFFDSFQPYHPGSSLLVYGTERFLAGGKDEPVVRFFDFRNSKPYHHFTALPCSSRSPFPSSLGVDASKGDQDVARERSTHPPASVAPSPPRCDFNTGFQCRWHKLCKEPLWRPDATIYLSAEHDASIHCLAKSSDLADTFYCGLRGELVEATMTLEGDNTLDSLSRTTPAGWRVWTSDTERMGYTLMETGVGRCEAEGWRSMDRLSWCNLYERKPLGLRIQEQRKDCPVGRLDTALTAFRRRGVHQAGREGSR